MAGQRKKSILKFTIKMQKKLVVLYLFILAAFIGLSARLFLINRDNGEEYKKQVLSHQEYDSVTIPFKRGEILDANGTVLAVSNKVYNVILDTKLLLRKEDYLEPTLSALERYFDIDTSAVRAYIAEHPDSSYYVMARRVEYEKKMAFEEFCEEEEEEEGKKVKKGRNIKGVWFEDEYRREYPNGSLACDVIGFTTGDNLGTYGLEEYYNDTLSGVNGRQYGYLNDDSTLERTTIAARDGNNIQVTIDANIQTIVEKYLEEFNEEYKNGVHPGNGAENVGCIIMDPDTAAILAMASYPDFDLNDVRNTENLIGMPLLDKDGKKVKVDAEGNPIKGDYVTEEALGAMSDEVMYQHLNALWKNFCIVDSFEPGSVAKPFTVAAALESGSITGNETYLCEGQLHVGDYDIKCHQIYGDGLISVQEGIERSCNVVLMNVAFAIGKDTFIDYQHAFNFGLRTNIDLAGETRTDSVVFNKNTMGITDLATNSFGQGFNATMIQMITGFCSLINGGNYYAPHLAGRITTADGATIENIEPRLLKQTISQSTSDTVKEYCNTVVTGEFGTGKTARPAGYMIGGKTGTAETLPRGNKEYVVSFMGYAPADDPQIVIYVVVDRPNVAQQDNARYATVIVRKILTEVLPYLNIFMTEELSDKEREELEQLQIQIRQPQTTDTEEEGEEGEPVQEGDSGTSGNEGDSAQGEEGGEEPKVNEEWKNFPVDPETGYLVDPTTGNYLDPLLGTVMGGGSLLGEETEEGTEPESGETPAGEDESAETE